MTDSCELQDPMNCSLPSFPVHGTFQAGILEWVAISFSRGSFRLRPKAGSPSLQADSLMTEPLGKTKSTYIQYLPDKIFKSGRHISINRQYYIMTL